MQTARLARAAESFAPVEILGALVGNHARLLRRILLRRVGAERHGAGEAHSAKARQRKKDVRGGGSSVSIHSKFPSARGERRLATFRDIDRASKRRSLRRPHCETWRNYTML